MRCSIHNSGDPNAVTTVRLAPLHFTPFLTALCIPAVSTFFLTLHPPGGGEVAWIISTRKKIANNWHWQEFFAVVVSNRKFPCPIVWVVCSYWLQENVSVELLICVANQRFPFFCISDFFLRGCCSILKLLDGYDQAEGLMRPTSWTILGAVTAQPKLFVPKSHSLKILPKSGCSNGNTEFDF